MPKESMSGATGGNNDGDEYYEAYDDEDLTGPFTEPWSVNPDEIAFLLAVAAQLVEEQRAAGKEVVITLTHLPESVAPTHGNEIYELEVSSIELFAMFHKAVEAARESAELQALEEFEGPFDEPWIIRDDRVELIKSFAAQAGVEMRWEADIPEKESQHFLIIAPTAQALSNFHDLCEGSF